MSDFDPVAFGRLEEKVEGLSKGQDEMKADLKNILDQMSRLKGAKWVLGSTIAVLASGFTHALHKLFP
jgi:hypothetical protein